MAGFPVKRVPNGIVNVWVEMMEESNGERDDLYEQVLEHARREIDASSSQVEKLRRTLGLLEARVEAARAVYEAAAARLNLEDESDGQGLSVTETLSSVQAFLSVDQPTKPLPRARNQREAVAQTAKQSRPAGDSREPWRRLQIGGSTVVWKRVKKPKQRQSQSGGRAS
jgi:hypothetical protein